MLETLLRVAQGKQQADLLLKNARILQVLTGEIVRGDIAVAGGYIAGIGSYDAARQVVDLSGRYVSPGFINAHCHVESSMVTPGVYCREEARWGTTTIITDPHEVANVAGVEGIRFMLAAARGAPVNYYVQLPSCVPSTPFESAGARLTADDLAPLLGEPGVLGLGEMMDYPGLLACDPAVLRKLAMARGRVVDGHAPSLGGRALQAYAAAGIATDHESVTFPEALEKLRAGIAVLVREGSASRNLDALVDGVVAAGIPTDRLAFCTDDKHIADIRREGTVRHCIRRAVARGLDTMTAYRMATINAARIYRLGDLGAVAPGYRADLVVLDDADTVAVHRVYKDGRAVDPGAAHTPPPGDIPGMHSVRLAAVDEHSLALPDFGGEVPVIAVERGQIVTQKHLLDPGQARQLLAEGNLCKVAVLERHHATGNVGVGLLAGYGLRGGAVASTVGHDSHNLIVAGTCDADMLLAVEEIRRIQGGYVLVRDGRVAGSVPLPVYGLMSEREPEAFIQNLEDVIAQVHRAGVDPAMDPFITLSFLALPVLPDIRITDKGVFDVLQQRFLT